MRTTKRYPSVHAGALTVPVLLWLSWAAVAVPSARAQSIAPLGDVPPPPAPVPAPPPATEPPAAATPTPASPMPAPAPTTGAQPASPPASAPEGAAPAAGGPATPAPPQTQVAPPPPGAPPLPPQPAAPAFEIPPERSQGPAFPPRRRQAWDGERPPGHGRGATRGRGRGRGRVRARSARNHQLSQRTTESLQREYNTLGLGGPITLTAISGGVGLVSLYAGLINEASGRDCDYGYSSYADCEDPDWTPYVVVAGLAAGGVVTGVVWLTTRLKRRIPISKEIRRRRRAARRRDWEYGALHLTPTPTGAVLHGRF